MTVELPKNCPICNCEKRFVIQKAIDNGVLHDEIVKEYGIDIKDIRHHIKDDHRETLIAFGVMDYTIRKHAIDVGETLAEFIEKWKEGYKKSTEKIKNTDGLKAMELLSKIEGKVTDKHEITMKRSIEDALTEFLGEEKQ